MAKVPTTSPGKKIKIGRRTTTIDKTGAGFSSRSGRAFCTISLDGWFDLEDEGGGWGMDLAELKAHVAWAEACLEHAKKKNGK